MKKLFLFLLCFVFILSVSTLNLKAQVVGEQPAADAEKKEQKADLTEKKDDKKEKTEVFTLGQIVVKKKRIANIEQATTTTVVTAKDIEAHSDRDLSDTLQTVPGMITYQHNKGHIRFKMRGFEMPYVAILVDGIPVADVYEANIDISKIPVMNASEIIINRGTSSALYGTTGTIGSINIVTKKPNDLYAKGIAEYGINGDYTFNAAHGNVDGNFYYWVTATVSKQAPYEVSKKLDKSERQDWYNKFFPSDLGYTINSTAGSDKYLNDTGNWPHQNMFKYNISAKTGYTFFKGFETGLTADYTKSESKRYAVSLTNTEETTNGAWSNSASSNTLSLGASAFSWRDVYTVTAAPYLNYENGDFFIKGNVFYSYTYEFLDGYADAGETTPVRGWGGDHSLWQNTSVGLNVFPSYKIANWNKLNSSVLFRWDKHVESEKADGQFVGTGLGNADAAYTLANDGWFNTKVMTMEQLTVALEDEVNLNKITNIPFNISAGISYDAQKFLKYDKRGSTMSGGRVTYFQPYMTSQYIAKEDSAIWGTRDSFNPVVGLTYEPLKDFLLLRGSYSQKTKLPTMSQYANVASNVTDDGLKPEKSYNMNAGLEFFFLQRSVSVRADYFYSKFKDKLASIFDPTVPGNKLYTNIKGEDHQGVEFITSGKFKDLITRILDLDLSLTYTYLRVKNLENSANSSINKGEKIADIPEHQVIADVRFDFFTKTALNIFGEYTAGAIKYAMKSNPTAANSFSTSYYKEVKLHNSLMINAKISQKIFEKYEAYVLCRNILDDYAQDPFNPGPGRQFFFGLSAEL